MKPASDLPKFAQKALGRLSPDDLIIRTSSGTEEAVKKGGGFLYSVKRSGRTFPTGSGKLLIDAGLLEPVNDGLIPEVSQTFVVARHG